MEEGVKEIVEKWKSVERGWWKRVLEEVMGEVIGGSDGSDGG